MDSIDTSAWLVTFDRVLGAHLPRIFGALLLLIIGWLVAVVVRATALKLLGTLKVNARINESTGQPTRVEEAVAGGLFWLVLLITLVSIFNVFNLDRVSNPFSQMVAEIVTYLPNLVGGVALCIIAWLVASLLKLMANRALAATTLDEQLSESAGMRPMSAYLGDVLFWLVILMFIPAILGVFQLNGLLMPVQNMMDKLLNIVPNIFAACVIGFVGWLVARVLRALTTNLLLAAGADRVGASLDPQHPVKIAGLAGTIVFIFIFIPTLISALDALKIEAISRPATNMLDQFLAAVPHIVAAVVILTITYYVARFVAGLIEKFLVSANADAVPEMLGLEKVLTGFLLPSRLVARLVMFFAMLFAAVEAANRLGFDQVRDVVTLFIEFGARVILGTVILIIGFWISGLARRVIEQTSAEPSTVVARITQFAILGLVFAMGLRAMGIANEIVQLAFALTLGAIAVAVALAFGLGGREAAGKLLDHWVSKIK